MQCIVSIVLAAVADGEWQPRRLRWWRRGGGDAARKRP